MTLRPMPPIAMLTELDGLSVVPALDVEQWARDMFVDEEAALANDEHAHLRLAQLGFLWTRVPNGRHGNVVVGTCEPGKPGAMGKWAKVRAEHQLEEWFGRVPDFLITLYAPYAASCGDAEFCALVEHELLHAGQQRDEFGAPKFHRSGLPVFAMRGHDVEEFVSIVRRYGVGAAAGQTLALVEAAQRAPQIDRADIANACGTCRALMGA